MIRRLSLESGWFGVHDYHRFNLFHIKTTRSVRCDTHQSLEKRGADSIILKFSSKQRALQDVGLVSQTQNARQAMTWKYHSDDVKNGIWNLTNLTFGMFALGSDTATVAVLAVVLGIATGGVVTAAGAVPI